MREPFANSNLVTDSARISGASLSLRKYPITVLKSFVDCRKLGLTRSDHSKWRGQASNIDSALSALDILGENDIPPERLAAKLVEIAERFKCLLKLRREALSEATREHGPHLSSASASASSCIIPKPPSVSRMRLPCCTCRFYFWLKPDFVKRGHAPKRACNPIPLAPQRRNKGWHEASQGER
jgi:hypothetical protein